MTRVLVHAGFHKTGTTSLQKYLAQNQKTLSQVFDCYAQGDFDGAGANARIYAQRPFIWRRKQFRRAMARFLVSIPDADALVLSREAFSGAMPGHRDWRGRTLQDYRRAAVPLCRDVADALRHRFGRDVEIEFLFTVRAPEAWLRSVYGHLVRSIHLTEDLDGFRALFRRPIDLQDEAGFIAKALAPLPVHVVALEDLQARHEGPAAAVLDLMAVPDALRTGLPPAKRHNIGQDAETEAAFLELNRSGMSKSHLRQAKERILQDQRP
ncbi:MAG: hypothetical protein AAGP08_12690 [Pseudomonadota bacterium]